MANTKISALAAATALAGTEILPVVQGDSTTKATIAQILTPAASVGVNFSSNTPAAGMTSQRLVWYEEGTWTPTDGSGAGLTFTTPTGYYTRVGRQVTAYFALTFPVTASGATQLLGGLPFAANSGSGAGGVITYTTHAAPLSLLIIPSSATISFRLAAGGSNQNNVVYSTQIFRGVVTYFI